MMKTKATSAEAKVNYRVAKTGLQLLDQENGRLSATDCSMRFLRGLGERASTPFKMEPYSSYRDFGINE